ncbi:MAG: PSD1 and planctomycete cytochrome C domain-containing protein [Planctomycetota bacterium]|nr:PSD1 and planctomycete cytochrome C domain-containing protein [Planctomycetota bacterium]
MAAFGDEPIPRTVEFNRDVRPILSDTCFACHGPDEGNRKAELRLDTEAGLKAARKGVAHSIAGELIKRITSTDADELMPPASTGRELTTREIAILKRWVEQGAAWQKHGAYIPPVRPQTTDPGNPIDELLAKRMQREGLEPAAMADRATLIRRLSLDVIGLPPTPTEVSDFVHDTSDNAFEKVVDRLLTSKHYGERMAVYWLDVVRYADSVGYHKDSHRNVWLYRDYVIDSFNDNKPFNQFVVEQLAGDLLEGTKFQQYTWKVASGFNRMNQTTSEGGAQAKEYLAKYSADRVRNTAAIFLGSTLGCAECHDHKYDPFTTKDFYSFAAFFGDLQERGVGFPGETSIPSRTQIEDWERIETELASLKKSDPKDARVASLEAALKQVSDSKTWPKTIITVSGKPRTIRVLPRGNWLDDSGPIVHPAIPAFLGSLDVKGRANRLDLAKWITSRDNPLTARVFVNRMWKLFFGQGLSRTLDDIGAQGQWPTHPAVLDWLAVEFIESGWDIRHLLKRIVMTDAYRRTSVPTHDQARRDPENRLFARQSRFRLEAEFVRDNALAISGLLSRKIGGRSVKPYQPANYWYRLYKDGKYNQDHGEDLYRRGVYTYWRRSFWHPSLQAFDAPAREECVAQRPNSNTPQQSLVLLNDPIYIEAARVFATRLIQDGGSKTTDRLTLAFQRAVARSPSQLEVETLTQLLSRKTARYAKDEAAAKLFATIGESPVSKDIAPVELAAWTSVARVILNLHETITRN